MQIDLISFALVECDSRSRCDGSSPLVVAQVFRVVVSRKAI